jgi:hypothetical protein
MRYIAGAIVVLAGSMLWAVGALAATWVSTEAGNRAAAEMAAYGGMVVVAVGCFILFLAHRDGPDDRPR